MGTQKGGAGGIGVENKNLSGDLNPSGSRSLQSLRGTATSTVASLITWQQEEESVSRLPLSGVRTRGGNQRVSCGG